MGMGAQDLATEHAQFLSQIQERSYTSTDEYGTVAALLMLIARIDDTNAQLTALREQLGVISK